MHIIIFKTLNSLCFYSCSIEELEYAVFGVLNSGASPFFQRGRMDGRFRAFISTYSTQGRRKFSKGAEQISVFIKVDLFEGT